MSNPFDKHRESPAAAQSKEAQRASLTAWCGEQNARKLCARMERWYYVREVDGVPRADCLEGSDGDNVRKLLEGKLRDFAGWPEARMTGYRRWLRSVAEAGGACMYEAETKALEPA